VLDREDPWDVLEADEASTNRSPADRPIQGAIVGMRTFQLSGIATPRRAPRFTKRRAGQSVPCVFPTGVGGFPRSALKNAKAPAARCLPAGAPRRRRNPLRPEPEEPSRGRCRPSGLTGHQPDAPHRRHDRRRALDDARDHVGTLNEARARRHVLDDATIDRVERVHTEQPEFVDICDLGSAAGRTERPTADQTRKLERIEEENRQLRAGNMEVLALAGEPRGARSTAPRERATTNSASRRSSAGDLPAGANPNPQHCVQHATVRFHADGLLLPHWSSKRQPRHPHGPDQRGEDDVAHDGRATRWPSRPAGALHRGPVPTG
jgi:hypothetical protein